VKVGNIADLERAVASAPAGTTILVQDGTYRLSRTLAIARPNVILRGLSGDCGKVILHGTGMQDRAVGVGVSIGASDTAVADLTIRDVGFHGIQVRGENGVRNVVLHNVHVLDTGQQLVKGSYSDNGLYSRNVVVGCSTFEYSDHAPSDYTNGVDVLGGRSWIVRDNVFRKIRGPEAQSYTAGPTVLFWRDSRDTRVMRNLVIDCFRGIALGLEPAAPKPQLGNERYFDHQGGVVCNNVVCNLHPWCDDGIEVNAAKDARIEHNTVLVKGQRVPWSIAARFPGCSAIVRNNLTNKPIVERDAARSTSEGNLTDAEQDWFVDAAIGNLRLASASGKAVDAGVELSKGAMVDRGWH